MIQIRLKATIVIHCTTSRFQCRNEVEVDGEVYLAERVDVESVPSEHDIIEGTTYEPPEGWERGVYSDSFYCPKCVEKRNYARKVGG